MEMVVMELVVLVVVEVEVVLLLAMVVVVTLMSYNETALIPSYADMFKRRFCFFDKITFFLSLT